MHARPASEARPTALTPATVPDDPLDLVPAEAVVAVAMSGGVDSSVAAARLVERGIETIGITLAMWPRSRAVARDRGCCGVDAVTDARRVAATLGIPHYPWDLEKDFRDEIIADFEDGYAAGRTPNPCVRCNERIKFGVLFARARAIGATHLATGHHARTGRRGSRATLHRSANSAKDQAYTLHRVPSSTLKAAVFPLGSMSSKEDVRSEARRLGLVTADKPDSQELCFVDSTVRVELQRRLKGRYGPGAIVDEAGNRVGAHEGLPFFTVGQRGGLNLAPQRPDAAPSYVVRLDVEANTIVTGPRASLQSSAVRADNAAWIAAPPRAGDAVGIQVTAHGTCHAATVTEAGANFGATFALPVGHVSPGQALVVYRGDEVLGGATISGGAS